jgi:hypothetical protein
VQQRAFVYVRRRTKSNEADEKHGSQNSKTMSPQHQNTTHFRGDTQHPTLTKTNTAIDVHIGLSDHHGFVIGIIAPYRNDGKRVALAQ